MTARHRLSRGDHRQGNAALYRAVIVRCSTWSGIVYVAFVVDVFSCRIVG